MEVHAPFQQANSTTDPGIWDDLLADGYI